MNTNTTSVWRKKLKELEIVVVIPTYNNGKTLAAVIEEVYRYADDIIVINDGSTDDTANILEQYPAIRTITHPVNKGKGTALKHGLSQAKKEGFRYAITIDSDGQHFASDIPCFIEAIEKEPDTLLVGARNLASDNMPGKNTFANKFSNFWFRLETGLKLEDTQSGYRLYPLRKMDVQSCWYTAKYEFELEAIVFAAWGRCSGEEHSYPCVLSPASGTGIPFPSLPGFYPYQCAEHGAGADYLPLDYSP